MVKKWASPLAYISCTGCALLWQACSVRGGEAAGTHQVAHKWDRLPLADVWHAVNDDETTSRAVRYTHRDVKGPCFPLPPPAIT